MEINISKSLNKNAVFFAVYAFGEDRGDTDALCDVRQKYFRSEKRLKNKLSMNCDGDIYKYAFVIENGKPLKWRKLLNGKEIEHSESTENGYCVETYTPQRKRLKRTYYTLAHLWQRTEYFSENDGHKPVMMVEPAFDGTQLVLQKTDASEGTSYLFPSADIFDRDMNDKINILGGEPEFICKTDGGLYFFCTRETHDRRQSALDRVLNEKEEQGKAGMQTAFSVDVSKVEDGDSVINISQSSPILDLTFGETAKTTDGRSSDDKKMAEKKAEEPTSESVLQEFENSKKENSEDMKFQKSEGLKTPESEKKTETPADALDESGESAEENDTKIPAAYIYEQPVSVRDESTFCTFASHCPYKNTSKQMIQSGESSYFYFGELENEKRSGRGRTIMKSGSTAYDGIYLDGKREGLGVYYYKSGKLCYSGYWKENKRCGFGAAFSPKDGTVYVGKWENDRSIGAGVSFDGSGNMLYMGRWSDGKKTGAGVSWSEKDDTVFVGKYKDGVFSGSGTQLDSDGTLLYSGGFKCGKRSGFGVSYSKNGLIEYSGTWKDGLYDGNGTLISENGCRITGEFSVGKLSGAAVVTDKDGKLIYKGEFKNGQYHGRGQIYFKDGYAQGEFRNGEMYGEFMTYSADGTHNYTGNLKNGERHGKGTEFFDDKKIYEGDFVNSLYDGEGKFYKNGNLVYEGHFSRGKRCGFGIAYAEGKLLYKGMWQEDDMCGSGILFASGRAKFVGMFKNGKKEGRVNELSGGRIVKQAIYHNDVCTYACIYGEKDGMPVYYGALNSSGKKEGMGCSFQACCEKQFEGIFRDDEPSRSMQVALKKLEPLEVCIELKDTEYERFSTVTDTVIEKPLCGGIYSGGIRGDKPEGKGTILFEDHRFTGMFKNGRPSGSGVIYTAEGDEVKGSFKPEAFSGCKKIKFQNSKIYYYTAKS